MVPSRANSSTRTSSDSSRSAFPVGGRETSVLYRQFSYRSAIGNVLSALRSFPQWSDVESQPIWAGSGRSRASRSHLQRRSACLQENKCGKLGSSPAHSCPRAAGLANQGWIGSAISSLCGVPPAHDPEELVPSASATVKTQIRCFCLISSLVAGSVRPVETMRTI